MTEAKSNVAGILRYFEPYEIATKISEITMLASLYSKVDLSFSDNSKVTINEEIESPITLTMTRYSKIT